MIVTIRKAWWENQCRYERIEYKNLIQLKRLGYLGGGEVLMNRGLPRVCHSLISIAISLFLCVVAIFSGCVERKPIRVGYIGGLTGRHYDLGISGRNGAIMAVDRINEEGGINGRKIKLIVRDDKQESETAKRAVRELIDEGVVAIIGHMTSSMSKETLPIVNKNNIVMISPTTSSSYFEKKDDNFFMLYPSTSKGAKLFSKYIYNEMGLRRVAVIYDISNRTYSESWYENFRSEFQKRSGKIVTARTFTSGEERSLFEIARELIDKKPEGILIIANALDTALICQQVRKINKKIALMTSEWAFTSDVLKQGGSAVEGVVFIEKINLESEDPRYKDFTNEYEKMFGRIPDFAASKAYEAVQVLAQALKVTVDRDKIKEVILRKHVFEGPQGEFLIDRYGDAELDHFIVTVINNRFKVLKKL